MDWKLLQLLTIYGQLTLSEHTTANRTLIEDQIKDRLREKGIATRVGEAEQLFMTLMHIMEE